MGLDMYLKSTAQEFDKEVDFDLDWENDVLLDYWRKHYELHRWMEELYLKKGGNDEKEFNGAAVVLNSDDLDALEDDVLANVVIDSSQGWYDDDKMSYLIAIQKARMAIAKGKTVYYYGSY